MKKNPWTVRHHPGQQNLKGRSRQDYGGTSVAMGGHAPLYGAGPARAFGMSRWLPAGISTKQFVLAAGLCLFATTAAAMVISNILSDGLAPSEPSPPKATAMRQMPSAYGVVVDASDSYTDYQKSQIGHALTRKVPSMVGRDESLILFEQTDDPKDPVLLLFDDTSPGRGDEHNIAYESPAIGQQKYDAFVARYRKELSKAMVPSTRRWSPICEAVVAASRHSKFSHASKKVLFLVTDGMEHVREMSEYRPAPTPPYPARCNSDLTGFTVHLLVIDRADPRQDRAVGNLKRWLTASGATVAMDQVY